MDSPGSGSGGDDNPNYWQQFEDAKKKKSYEKPDKYPAYDSPTQLFSLKNENAVFIKPGRALLNYQGGQLTRLKQLISAYDIRFTNGDQYLENSNLPVEKMKQTPIGKLSLARDELLAFLLGIYNSDKEEWELLRITGFLRVMIRVAQGATCNNELAGELRKCLGLK